MPLVMLDGGRQLQDVECLRQGRSHISVKKEDRLNTNGQSVTEVFFHLGGQSNTFKIEAVADLFFAKPKVVFDI